MENSIVFQRTANEFAALATETFGARETIMKGALIVEVPLSNARSSYTFDFNKTQNASGPNEIRLDAQDIFAVTGIFIGLRRELITTSTPTAAQPGRGVLVSYPSPQIFGGAQARNLEAIYNGNWNFKAGQAMYIEDAPMLPFRKVPKLQYSDWNVASAYDGNYDGTPDPEVDRSFAGVSSFWQNQRKSVTELAASNISDLIEPLVQTIRLEGQAKNTITVNFQNGWTGFNIESGVAGQEHRLCIYAEGIRVTKFQPSRVSKIAREKAIAIRRKYRLM